MAVDNPSIISTKLVYEAISFYMTRGFEMIDVPMCVSKEAIDMTCPPGAPVLAKGNEFYVGSAEQSFIQLHLDGVIGHGKYMALTPCHRVEPRQDDLHFEMFLKLELIDINPRKSTNPLRSSHHLYDEAIMFFDSQGITTTLVDVPGGKDILINGIEVGSYGTRKLSDFGPNYFFGTGLAEPRTSYAISKGK